MNTKQLHMTDFKVLNEDRGEVEAVFAELEVKDHHGDVTMKGAFQTEDVRISAYNHGSWASALPVGKGTISEVGKKAIFKGQFFMDTQAGRETFIVVKELEDLGEWSYGYDTLEEERGTFKGERVNIIKKQKVHEVSPVLLGAGIGTQTIGTKSLTGLSPTMKQLYSEVYDALRQQGRDHFHAGEHCYVYVRDFDIDKDFVVYCISRDEESRYVQMGFTRGADGSVELGDEEMEVEIEESYVPVKGSPLDRQHKGEQESDLPDSGVGKGLKFSDHSDAVIAAIDELSDRAAAVVTLRTEQGKSKPIGDEMAGLLKQVEARMENLKGLLQKHNDELSDEDRLLLDHIAREIRS